MGFTRARSALSPKTNTPPHSARHAPSTSSVDACLPYTTRTDHETADSITP
jgi:hypothetical protein